jgi:glutamate synthase domain-containing protein 2
VHLVADRHGRAGGGFLADLVRRAHERLVAERMRDRVTLLAGGGIVTAEHVPKAIACGADAVALDTVLWVALQGDPAGTAFPSMAVPWGVQRITNLAVSWRDQLLEVLGAMGMREVRRLRGEYGRLMLQRELEHEAFSGIEGYDAHAQAAR